MIRVRPTLTAGAGLLCALALSSPANAASARLEVPYTSGLGASETAQLGFNLPSGWTQSLDQTGGAPIYGGFEVQHALSARVFCKLGIYAISYLRPVARRPIERNGSVAGATPSAPRLRVVTRGRGRHDVWYEGPVRPSNLPILPEVSSEFTVSGVAVIPTPAWLKSPGTVTLASVIMGGRAGKCASYTRSRLGASVRSVLRSMRVDHRL